ncbi:MAG: hypothetical protein LBL49_01875 [Clostridiales Family XIII bacterium]|jgi:hypothetical protein|nr:hypothetical protein [Clostridiales Family XIII bacterium]
MFKKIIATVLVLSLLSVTCVTSFALPINSVQTAGQAQDLLSLVAAEDFQGIAAVGFTVHDLDYDNGVTSFSIDITPDVVNSFAVSHLSAVETQIVIDEVDSDGNTCTDTVLFDNGVLSTIDGAAVDFTTVSNSQVFSAGPLRALPVWQYYADPPGSTTKNSYNMFYDTYDSGTIEFGQTVSNITVTVLIAVLSLAFTAAGLGAVTVAVAGVAYALVSYMASDIKSHAYLYASSASFSADIYRIQGDLEIREKHSLTYNYPQTSGITQHQTFPFYRWFIG